MPFKEIKPLKDYIRVHDKTITISSSLLPFFKGEDDLLRVKLFIDEENQKVGMQPSKEGYKLTIHGGGYTITCASLVNKLASKEYFPVWDKKLKMLVFDYGAI